MSDDSETVEDTEKGSLAEVTDDSCTVAFIEIVPLDRASDDYRKLEFIAPVVEVKPEDLQEIKQESTDENDSEDPNYFVKQEPSDEYEIQAPCFTADVSSIIFRVNLARVDLSSFLSTTTATFMFFFNFMMFVYALHMHIP